MGIQRPGQAPGPLVRNVNPAYGVRTREVSEDGEGYSPILRSSAQGVPDSIRVGDREPPDQSGDHGERTARRQWQRRTSDFHRRHSDEVTVQGWNVRQQRVHIPVIPDQVQDKPPVRRTAVMGPATYMHTRPWPLPQSTGEHLSLADHRRTFPVGGMKPQGRVGANIYRREPRPWDEDLYTVDLPPGVPSPSLSRQRWRK